jgi:Ni,Fe-hydrogenase III small subunit/ferredoxin-like protein FixX
MLEWIARGLRKGIVTTHYPRRPEPAPHGFHGRVEVVQPAEASPELERICPTGAIVVDDGAVRVDRGRCILCAACVAADPERFRFVAEYETAFGADGMRPLVQRARPLRRSIHIRHVDSGSDGSEEWEIQALTNPYYDMQRLGLYFTAAPRHADVLLVTGGVTQPMEAPLRRAWEVMPEPKALVAAGTDACSGGFSALTGETAGGVASVLPVDVFVPGSPPSPIALLHGLLLAAGIVTEQAA